MDHEPWGRERASEQRILEGQGGGVAACPTESALASADLLDATSPEGLLGDDLGRSSDEAGSTLRALGPRGIGILDRGPGAASALPEPRWAAALRRTWAAEAARASAEARGTLREDEDDLLVWDDAVMDVAPVWTTPALEEALGAADRLAIHVVAGQVVGASPTLTVRVEHSGDQRHWLALSATPEIDAAPLSTSTANVVTGATTVGAPLLGFVRLRISLSSAAAPPTAHVVVRVQRRFRGRED